MPLSRLYAVIMAGGSGTRFWPLGRQSKPKQLLPLFPSGTLLQAAAMRCMPLIPPDRILIVTNKTLVEQVRSQLPLIPAENIIGEPEGRDTAACVALAATLLHARNPQAIMAMLPADQVIAPVDAFQSALQAATLQADKGSIVVFGIQPRHPATGYGYVELSSPRESIHGQRLWSVERFVEKPDEAKARAYVHAGNYRWNSGIFVWRTKTVLSGLSEHCQDILSPLAPLGPLWGKADFDQKLAQVFPSIRKISIDYALLENARGIVAVDAPFAWDDLGSWDAFYEHERSGADNNVLRGETLTIDCRDSLLLSHGGRLIAGIGLEDLIVVDTPDAVLICPRGRSQRVKEMVDALKKAGKPT
jgi:mannose-1-phosphate guanylyltransferase